MMNPEDVDRPPLTEAEKLEQMIAIKYLFAGATATHESLKYARRINARGDLKQKPTKDVLIESRTAYINRYGTIRGWLKGASISFDLNPSTIKKILNSD